MTNHFQNILGYLALTSHLEFAFVSSLNWDSCYIPLALAELKLGLFWKHPLPPLPSADIYHVTCFSLGNMKHMAVSMLGTAYWKLSALKLNMLLGVSRAEWGVFNPALETQQRCIPTDVCKHSKYEINIWFPDKSIQSTADGFTQSTSGSVLCIQSSKWLRMWSTELS